MKRFFVLLLILAISQSCGKKESRVHEKKEIDAAMREYDRVIQKLDADEVANLYDEEGDLGSQAHGREEIKKFLLGFTDLEILSQTSSTDAIEMLGDSAVQTGSYVQILVEKKKDTVTYRGTYNALWRWDGDNWKLKRMDTQPL